MSNNKKYILCLETATTNCSVALSFGGKQVAIKEDYDVKYSHAERLHIYIEEVLAFAKISKNDLSAIAISKGPGSYTGLRIGVSAAKGLCFALDIPLISIPTLDALALQATPSKGDLIIPMLDARRMEVYSAVYDTSFKQIRKTQAQVLTEESFTSFLNDGVVHFIGNGVEKFAAVCKHANARFISGKLPSAKELCDIAWAKFENQNFEDVAYFEPYYLKDFIAGKPKKK
ncbi:tRNA (adenosine(37)-N6)-threonylcarbamoyltransferase complex dimerization subunit type 1 TsaB [Dokdonia sinensis]|uniref:tRNA (Adenosine(37)-N6)-threonylcarbamoyltransferase complex dimerization subunit type 1 TsaB n=1 Tax=Dokdonia sinensis TaxID=2479847 RepID=A0A3M0G2Y1_9FLAO|nr:tRNA (adenosine(37)-N6)-threonylcarbamoyltransferase complex dimerization subunit type 1 TsaB [Dokdonia sinensis]RMB56562.1 tRNA (adenosine(37)-N6)-threonylcarbamoyltransferase complex dimerization subunit type 1 TsaB [Dokdonia sinensis]